jgi:copper chaperone CopZ
MPQIVAIEGMHCAACVKRVTRALQTVTPDVTVSLEPPRAVLNVAQPLPIEALAAAVARAGDYEVRPAG